MTSRLSLSDISDLGERKLLYYAALAKFAADYRSMPMSEVWEILCRLKNSGELPPELFTELLFHVLFSKH